MSQSRKSNGKPNNDGKPDDGATEAQPSRAGIPVPPEKRCAFTTEKGTPCRAARRQGRKYCIFHDDDFQEERTRLKVTDHFLILSETPMTSVGIQELLRRNVEAVAASKITSSVANSISYAAQVMSNNLPRLAQERTAYNIREDAAHRLARILLSAELDQVEEEIKKAGIQAFPGHVARAYAEQIRAAQQDSSPESHNGSKKRPAGEAGPEAPQAPET